jgi:hypothetical protein
MEERIQVDVSQYSFDEFISFLFARGVPGKTEEYDPWYFHVEVTFAPRRVCDYYLQLFRQPEFLLKRFSKDQIEEGFWVIQGPNLDCSVSRLIWNADVEFPVREECVRTMFDLYKRLFAVEHLDSSAQMWWDSICYDWHCGNRNRDRGGEDLEMQDVIFETLSRILSLDSEFCQRAALHGLGHLHHPETQELVDLYLKSHLSLSEESRAYALAAAKFEVL